MGQDKDLKLKTIVTLIARNLNFIKVKNVRLILHAIYLIGIIKLVKMVAK